jgi:hypothetical protein
MTDIVRFTENTDLIEAGRKISAKNRALIAEAKGYMDRQVEECAMVSKIHEALLNESKDDDDNLSESELPPHAVEESQPVVEGEVHTDESFQESTESEDEVVQESTRFLFEAVGGKDGREWDVIIIEAGMSLNRRFYPAEVLRNAIHLFEGKYAFADHATEEERRERPERSIKDKVGVFHNVRFESYLVNGVMREGLKARFKVVSPWLRELLVEAVKADEPDFVGFSIDAEGKVKRKIENGQVIQYVESITNVHSVDVVTDPAAGGKIVRLVASNREDTPMEINQELADFIKAQISEGIAANTPAVNTEPSDEIREALSSVAAVKAELRLSNTRATLVERLAESKVSEPGKTIIRNRIMALAERREVEDAEIDAAITETLDYEGALLQSNHNPSGVGRTVERMVSDRDKLDSALAGMFAGAPVNDVQPFRTLKEAYCRWTGQDYLDVDPLDLMMDFGCRYDSRRDNKRVRESLATASWGEIYADNLYMRLIAEYRAAPYQTWRKICSEIESVPDFQTRHWMRVGGYSDLTTVAESATYPMLTSPTDEETTYSISKRGGLDDVTFEAIVNDRFGAIRRVPSGMARAAARTLHKFVMNMVTTDNPTLGYDATALYAAGHGNDGTTALSLAGLNAVSIAMRDQTAYNESLEILGERNKPKFLIVPNELEQRAIRIIDPSDTYTFAMSSTPDADTSIDPQAFKGKGLEIIVYDVLTDAGDWFTVANPAEVETLVVGFLNGRQEPEMFVQDMPNVGNGLTADKITYKIRHIYGGTVLDHRSFYRQVA